MPTTVSLGPLYRFPGWIVSKVSISSNGDEAYIHLCPDHCCEGFRFPCCSRRMEKMRERWRKALDLPL